MLTSQRSLLDKVPHARLLSRPSVILRHLEQLSSVNLGIRGRETAATDDLQLSAAVGQLSLEELPPGEESVTPALDLRHIALTGRRDNFLKQHFSTPTTYLISSRSPAKEESSLPGPRRRKLAGQEPRLSSAQRREGCLAAAARHKTQTEGAETQTQTCGASRGQGGGKGGEEGCGETKTGYHGQHATERRAGFCEVI